MDGLESLRSRLDIAALMRHYDFDHMVEEGNFIRSCCALHGGNNATGFVANVEEGTWYCHTGGCGGGDAFTLVQRKEELSWTQSVRWLADFFKVEISDTEVLQRKTKEEQELKRWIKAIQQRRKKENSLFIIPSDAKNVTSFRDFDKATLEHFNLKWVKTFDAEKRGGGGYELRNRILFPVVQNGSVVGASLRRVNNKDIPKWSHQPAHMKTSELLYNYDAVTDDIDSVVVVEGIPDVWAYHEIGVVAVGTFGAHLTETQLKMLLRTGKDIVISTDGDEAGRMIRDKIISLMRYTSNLSVVHFDEGEDPANIPREELRMRYEKRV